MDTFEKLVKDCADSDSTRIIENASMDHAKVLLRQLLQTANDKKEPVRIVSGRLRKEFYNELVDKARHVLNETTISVVVLSDEQLQNNRFYDLVKHHSNGQVTLLSQDPNRWTHFIVVGDRRYRVEVDDGKHTAHASFNNEVIPRLLHERFEELLRRARAA